MVPAPDSSEAQNASDEKPPTKEAAARAGTKRSTPDAGSVGSDDGNGADMKEVELDPEKRREVRKMRRVMANRRSARESRERRKKFLIDLQESVENLTSENADLSKENLNLRRELASLIEQSGGIASLNTIPNIQGLLQTTQGLSGLAVQGPASAAVQVVPPQASVDGQTSG